MLLKILSGIRRLLPSASTMCGYVSKDNKTLKTLKEEIIIHKIFEGRANFVPEVRVPDTHLHRGVIFLSLKINLHFNLKKVGLKLFSFLYLS